MNAFVEKMRGAPRKLAVTGHFGSGKTEFAVSLAFALAAAGVSPLALVDVDIENPYFRSREQGDAMRAAGIRVYSDAYGGKSATELQTLDPAIRAPLEDGSCRVICDLGGDASGAMILNQYSKYFQSDSLLLFVLNRSRPGTDSLEKALAQLRSVESVTGFRVGGIISNTHMLRFTSPADVREGWTFARELSEKSGVPALCACCMESLLPELAGDDIPLFPIGLYMRPTYLDRQV